jgi:hypothetical protein
MPRRYPGSPISVSLSTRGSWMPAWLNQHVAAVSGIGALDIDATGKVASWLATRWGAAQPPYVRVNAIWISYRGVQAKSTERIIDALLTHQVERPPLVVVNIPGSNTLRGISRDLEPVRKLANTWPLAIGLPSSTLRGGRPHLVYLGALRHFVEEWDLSLALDLSGNFDPTWEAEAAVARLGDRLSILRVRASAPSRAAVGQDRVACRAIHAAIDRGRLVDIAFCATGMVPLLTTPRAAAHAAHLAAAYVHERAMSHAEALREGIDHFEGSTPSRGA